MKELKLVTRVLKLVKTLMEEGIVPRSELSSTLRILNFVNALIVSGIGPINLFESRLNSPSDVSWPMVLGIVPLIWQLEKYKKVIAWKLPIEVGKEPFKATEEREMVRILP